MILNVSAFRIYVCVIGLQSYNTADFIVCVEIGEQHLSQNILPFCFVLWLATDFIKLYYIKLHIQV